MTKVSKGKEKIKQVKMPRGWKPPPTPLERAHKMVDSLLDVMEAELRSERPVGERYEQLFGSKGLLANLPKLLQLLESMADPDDEAGPEEETLSRDDLRLLKEWLGAEG